jgi:integrase/recombinase XerC
MDEKPTLITIANAIEKFADFICTTHSEDTVRAYKNGLYAFCAMLLDNHIDPKTSGVNAINNDFLSAFVTYLENYSPATERLYLHSVKRFYEFIEAEGFVKVNLSRAKQLIRQREKKPRRQPLLVSENVIGTILNFISNIDNLIKDDSNDEINILLRALRDRAFLLTLADTGLRVHEACNLRRGDVDWNEGQAMIIGKGNKQAIIRFSTRSLRALKDYISARAALDGASGRPLPTQPHFAPHDKGAGKKGQPITTTTGRNIVTERVHQALGEQDTGQITPHSFRHYFVTIVLRASGNLKLAQELARHSNIQTTQQYAHLSNDELDRGYHDIFEKNL